MLLHRYGNIDFIMKSDMVTGFGMLSKAIEKRDEALFWDMWLMKYQHMNRQNFISFGDFYHKRTLVKQISQRPADEILKEVQEIRKLAGQPSNERG